MKKFIKEAFIWILTVVVVIILAGVLVVAIKHGSKLTYDLLYKSHVEQTCRDVIAEQAVDK